VLQLVVVVEILVAERDPEHPLTDQGRNLMLDIFRTPTTFADSETRCAYLYEKFALAVRRAFAEAGVEFIDANGGGPGVRLRQNNR
jgi:hypothetical protein